MVSVERVVNYSELEPEREFESRPCHKPNNEWPASGRISFHRVSLRYDPDQPPVLDQIDFEIRAQEKVYL